MLLEGWVMRRTKKCPGCCIILLSISTSHTCTLGHIWPCIIHCFWRPETRRKFQSIEIYAWNHPRVRVTYWMYAGPGQYNIVHSALISI